MTQQHEELEWLGKLLKPYHFHSCQSNQAWVKGMTKPFPCDCGLEQSIAQKIEASNKRAVLMGRLDEMRSFKLNEDAVLAGDPKDALYHVLNYQKQRIKDLEAQLQGGKDEQTSE